MIRVFAIFKNPIFLTALKPFLQSNGIEVVCSSSNSSLALDYYKNIDTDLVMMDLNWPASAYTVSGASLISQLRKQNPNDKIIGFTTFYDAHTASRLNGLALQGYFYKSTDNLLEQLKECIERVHETCLA